MAGVRMASSTRSADLSRLQWRVLHAFFERERDFFLTGGGALAGYHLHHRATDDLDLFTLSAEAFERGRFVVPAIAQALGMVHEIRQQAPGFARHTLSGPDGVLVLDLVHERVYQVDAQKQDHDGVRVDSPEEIFANKLAAAVGRQEERDLIDIMYLERMGLDLDTALSSALRKDGGCTPATLAWLLSQLEIADDAVLPAGVPPRELREYLADLTKRLRRKAAPPS